MLKRHKEKRDKIKYQMGLLYGINSPNIKNTITRKKRGKENV
jgi:hypothetical protein